jgi:agmatinase
MRMDSKRLERLRSKYGTAHAGEVIDPEWRKVANRVFGPGGTRAKPYAGVPTLLAAPYRPLVVEAEEFGELDVALIGVPMDLGVSNRTGARFGPRALRTIERIGPYNNVLRCAPVGDLRVADVGDVPFRSRFDLDGSIADIERYYHRVVAAGVAPLSVGGDHSITHPILKAIGKSRSVGLVHIDAHCDTGGEFDGAKFHHAGPFRNAVLDGVLDPARTIQIGIRGSAEYLWEFSYDAGMTVIHMEELAQLGCNAVIAKAREVVGSGPVYVSFDIDSLDPSFAPGTGTPEVGGLTTREVQQILRGLKGLDVIGGDVVEVAPQYDATTNTVQAGAQMLFEILSLMVFSPSIGRRQASA